MQQIFSVLCAAGILHTTGAWYVPFDPTETLPNNHAEESGGVRLWALLVAGSNGYYNYRHQADVCHAYHVLHNHGIPDERIVVMMYDDIANSTSNPTPGVILNHLNGTDVYNGVPKDYTGELVTPHNFLSVLQGKAISGGSGKVIDSGPEDHVFVFFSDHGAPGLVCFPEENLLATNFTEAIVQMHKENKFAKMVLYIEACESGSMFDGLLPDNINVFATTAANPEESSYACYYDDLRQTYLGDLYSVSWMEDSDRENLHIETLKKQFRIVKAETNLSHVTEYGDISIRNMKVSEFQGFKTADPIILPDVPLDLVDNRDVPLAVLRKRIEKESNSLVKSEIEKELEGLLHKRMFVKNRMAKLVTTITNGDNAKSEFLINNKLRLRHRACYEEAVSHFDSKCFKLPKNPYVLGHLYILVNFCEDHYHIDDIRDVIDAVCVNTTIVGVE